ncbi:MAG: Na/Pi symporter [Spirochaetaceae bacterium]|nr:Na/Pi symporter [Spirochaetaceae bacterium]
MIATTIGQILEFGGSLCLLLFGMEMLSNGIQKGAGSSLQTLLGKISSNRFSALLTGVSVTAIIQSSGATTVMVVSFVNAEILTLTQAIGIIFGANIGTTVTAWIVSLFGFSFSIEAAAIPLFGFGFVLKYFKKIRLHDFADSFMGFAFLFMGLGLLKSSMELKPNSMAFLYNLANLGFAGLLLGVMIGAFFTALIHSSSATTAIILTMAANNSLPWNLAAAVVLGSNIGSTVDAVMSCFKANVNARRTAAIHVGFNVLGTAIALCLFQPFLALVDFIVPLEPQKNITAHIAMLHTIFNVSAALIFLPFVNQIAKIAQNLIKESVKEESTHYKLPAILPVTHISSDLYLFQIQKEIVKMTDHVMSMFDLLHSALKNRKIDEESVQKILSEEEYIDEMNHGISDFLQKCIRLPNSNQKNREDFSHLISMTQNLEDLSDECCSLGHTMLKFYENPDINSFEAHNDELNTYFEQVHLFFEQACTYIALGISDEDKLLSLEIEDGIDSMKKELKRKSRKRIEDGSNVKAELKYMDLVRKIEKAGDCVFGVIRAMSPNLEELYGSETGGNLLKAQNLIVNVKNHKVFVSGNEVKLAGKEYDLLVVLLKNRGNLVSREELLKTVWKYESDIESRTLDVHIRLLRQKFGNAIQIETVRGTGYRLK